MTVALTGWDSDCVRIVVVSECAGRRVVDEEVCACVREDCRLVRAAGGDVDACRTANAPSRL